LAVRKVLFEKKVSLAHLVEKDCYLLYVEEDVVFRLVTYIGIEGFTDDAMPGWGVFVVEIRFYSERNVLLVVSVLSC